MTATREALDPQDRLLVAALASGVGQDSAGAIVGVSGRTVRRRLASNPALREAVREERDALAGQVAGLLVAQAIEAVHRLMQIVNEGNDRNAVQASRVVVAEARQHRGGRLCGGPAP